ncbi:MAG: 30S ribosomal protein S16 [Verrucomicrobiota bacterium]|nr:30S ribosomal protein S16 [Verrucomicrobiota bacterium]
MSVKIRMTRTGGKNEPSFRVVATDSRSPRDGRYLESLGWYDPKKPGVNFSLAVDRIERWTTRGAVLSQSVKTLLNKARRTAKAAN